jgi:hypothetical protein
MPFSVQLPSFVKVKLLSITSVYYLLSAMLLLSEPISSHACPAPELLGQASKRKKANCSSQN